MMIKAMDGKSAYNSRTVRALRIEESADGVMLRLIAILEGGVKLTLKEVNTMEVVGGVAYINNQFQKMMEDMQ